MKSTVSQFQTIICEKKPRVVHKTMSFECHKLISHLIFLSLTHVKILHVILLEICIAHYAHFKAWLAFPTFNLNFEMV